MAEPQNSVLIYSSDQSTERPQSFFRAFPSLCFRAYNQGLQRGIFVAGEPGEITLLLKEWRSGDKQAEARLFALLEPELRKIAIR